eukprot:m.12000 g.12000  ORF g.12000 m.12000 type:complete len:259 (-) comp3933_c0_seq1:193-969(-)
MLRGVRVLVTGASSGIGLATARILAREEATVIITGRKEQALKQLSEETSALYIASDLTQEGECKRVVDFAVKKLGSLTSLVNCAGILKGGAFGSEACDLDNLKINFDINTKSVFEMMTHAANHMKQAEIQGSIVNISSVNGKQSFGGCASYCMSKAATDMLARCAAVDLAPYGIRVNNVNPGVITTELQKRGGLTDGQYEEFLRRSVSVTHPLAAARGKVGTPDEVGELIAFLISDKAAFITGECIAIDGGRQCLGAR